MVTAGPPILTLGRALKARYGRRLRRVMLDLGLSCPNRDGTSGYGGCAYCDLEGSGTGASKAGLDLAAQWEVELKRVRRSQAEGPCAIAYLQSYSNTWPDLQPLSRALDFLRPHRDTAPILAVGTRPDCFSEEAAELLGQATADFDEVWVELGLETTDNAVQASIGRHDNLANFFTACERAHRHGLKIIVHCMAGLPGDAADTLMHQVRAITKAGAHGVKFHQLMILRRTKLAHAWMQGEVEILSPETYIQAVAEALQILPPEIVVHRLVAESPEEERLAPKDWPSAAKIRHRIEEELKKPGTRPGGGW